MCTYIKKAYYDITNDACINANTDSRILLQTTIIKI